MRGLSRLFSTDGECFEVASERAFFKKGSFLSGIGDDSAAARTIDDAQLHAVPRTRAALVDQLAQSRDMPKPFAGVRPANGELSHRLFTAVLESKRTNFLAAA
jgi:hypothetical protein